MDVNFFDKTSKYLVLCKLIMFFFKIHLSIASGLFVTLWLKGSHFTQAEILDLQDTHLQAVVKIF